VGKWTLFEVSCFLKHLPTLVLYVLSLLFPLFLISLLASEPAGLLASSLRESCAAWLENAGFRRALSHCSALSLRSAPPSGRLPQNQVCLRQAFALVYTLQLAYAGKWKVRGERQKVEKCCWKYFACAIAAL